MSFAPQGGAPTGVEVNLDFFPLAFLLYMCTPVVEINGQARQFSWGKHFIPLQPGGYHVKIFFPYMFYSECGANSIQISVMPGQVKRLWYYMWPLMFLPGSLSEG